MAAFTKDSGSYRKFLIGVLAAGSGVAVYYGYTKWKNRPYQDIAPADDGKIKPKGKDKASEEKEVDTTETKVSESSKPVSGPSLVSPLSDDAPIQTSTPSVSRTSSHDPSQDLLSLSGSFEKVSLSALRENNDDNSSGDKSPSESFEKVSLPSSSSNSAESTPPTKEDKPISPSSSGPRVQFDEKVIKHDSPPAMKSPPSTLPKPKFPTKDDAKIDPPASIKPQTPAAPAQSPPPAAPAATPAAVPSKIPQPVRQTPAEMKPASPKPSTEALKAAENQMEEKKKQVENEVVKSNEEKPKEKKEEEEEEEEEEEAEGDDEGGSESDASGDSQIEATRV